MVTLTNCNIVNLESGSIEDGSRIAIVGSTIKDIGRSQAVAAPGLEIDLGGSYVLPGLFNVHNNISNVFPFKNANPNESPAETVLRCLRRAQDALLAGVTTLRTMGEINRADLPLRKMIGEGWVRGPRIVAAGKGIGITGGHGSHLGQIEADGADNCRKAARHELSLGADHLKVFITGGIAGKAERLEEPQMSEDEIRAVVSVASSKGTYVAAHAGSSNPIRIAVRAGVRSIEHGYVLDKEAVREMKENDCYFVPTLSVTRSANWMRANGFETWTIEKAESAGARHMDSARLAVQAGVKIAAGTDLPPGDLTDGVVTTVKEIEHLHEAGLTAHEALKSATIRAAELCMLHHKLGLVKPNYLADLIAVPRNPLKDIKSLERIEFVTKDGEVMRNDLALPRAH